MATGNVNALTNTFSGADVAVIFGDSYIGECMSFTVGVNREAGPLYTMGRKEPIAIPKGKRGIAGSFILAQLGYDALIQYYSSILGSAATPIWVRNDEIGLPIATPIAGQTGPGTLLTNESNPNSVTSGTTNGLWQDITNGGKAGPQYVDQMPPFNVTVIGVNEQGTKMGFRVYGVSIVNEGMALSIEELNMEKRYTFIAQSVSAMQLLLT